jgi:hypothetical protein
MGHQWQENIYILLFIKCETNLEATSKNRSQMLNYREKLESQENLLPLLHQNSTTDHYSGKTPVYFLSLDTSMIT